MCSPQNCGFVSQEGGTCPPPRTRGSHNVSLVCAAPGFSVAGGEGLPFPSATPNHSFVSVLRGGGLCHRPDMSAMSHSRHGNCVTQPTCLLCRTADMSPVSYSRCLLCHTADMSAVSHSRILKCIFASAFGEQPKYLLLVVEMICL